MRSTRLCLFAVLIGFVAFGSPAAPAAPVDYVLDPARSTFRLGGTFNGTPLVAQSPGTDLTGYTGTLSVDVDRSAGTLSHSTSPPRAQDQPQDQLPLTDFRQGANYGLKTAAGDVLLAARAMDLNVRVEDAPFNAGAPSFDQVPFFVNGGSLYYSTPAGPGGADLHGYGGAERVLGPITLVREGDLETLTIPISTHFTPYTGEGGDVINFTLGGQLVATRLVPEPHAALGLLGLAILALRRRGRSDRDWAGDVAR